MILKTHEMNPVPPYPPKKKLYKNFIGWINHSRNNADRDINRKSDAIEEHIKFACVHARSCAAVCVRISYFFTLIFFSTQNKFLSDHEQSEGKKRKLKGGR